MLISIIILTYNSKNYLEKSLHSIFSQKNEKKFEVIVVDNGSSDNSEKFIRTNFPSVKILRNERNRGASYARNQGIEISTGDYLMFMDSDAYLGSNFLPFLEYVLEDIPQDVSAISPKILNADSNKIFSCGLHISSIYRSHDIGKNRPSDEFRSSFFIDGPTSCCAIFKRGCLEAAKDKNGYFDNDFFFLFEDTDLALRLKRAGHKSIFMPQLICCHYGNSSDTPSQLRRYFCFRNRLYMVLKNNPGGKIFLFFLKSFFYDTLRTLYFFLTNKYSFLLFKDLAKKAKK